MRINIKEKSKLLSDRAMQCCMRGDYDEALKYFDEGLSEDEDNIFLLYNKAGCLNRMGDFESSKPVFEKIIELCDEKIILDEFTLNIKANSYAFLGDFDTAGEIFEKVLKHFPNNVDALTSKAISLKREFEYDESLKCFDKALSLDPDNFQLNMYKGELLLDMGKKEESKQFIDKAYELDSNFPYVWYLKGQYHSKAHEDYKKAICCYEKAVELEPDFNKCYYDLGICHVLLGNAEKAKEAFRKVSQFDPERSEMLDEITDFLSSSYPR